MPTVWKTGPEGGTPLSAAALNDLEGRVDGKLAFAEKGAVDGVAPLAGRVVPRKHLPPEPRGMEVVIEPTRVHGAVGTRLTLPTHIAANTTGQSTHPSVEFRAEGWNGYPYWMAHTPYQGASDAMEDPNVAASMDGITWVVPAGLVNPLDDAPGSPSNYNSDTEIAFGPDDNLYVFWRNLDPTATGAEERLYYRRSADGVTWGPKTLVYQSSQATLRLLSPSLIFEDGRWTLWAVDIATTPDRIVRLRSNTSDPTWGTAGSNWSAPVAVTYRDSTGATIAATAAYQSGKAPWHIHVVRAYGRYHMLVNDNAAVAPPNGDLVYMTSPDGIVWTSAVNPCIPRGQAGQHEMLYRACMIPAVERGIVGFRVWYGALMYTPNPQVWSIFRTFISDGPHVERGSFVATVPAATSTSAPGGYSRDVVFARPFKGIPDIVLSSDTGFVGPAAALITSSGFRYYVDNPMQVAANDRTFYWTASEPI